MFSILCNAFIQTFAKHMLDIITKMFIKTCSSTMKYFPLKYKMMMNEYLLESHPIESNEQLLSFNVRSKTIAWRTFITPLQSRGPTKYLYDNYDDIRNFGYTVNENNHRKVLVCHDMMGNYLEDRFFNSSKKWDDYRFYHWSGIDYFCYFSHHYVTIPPPNWINAAHMHGVPVLGTFIAEGSNSRLLDEILQSKDMIDVICEKLVHVCKHFYFEGWFINIECPVDPHKVNNLINFVNTLRIRINNEIPNGVVFWYDSVIKSGQLSWQNEINEQNIQFFNVSNGILINYTWNEQCLRDTDYIVKKENHKCENVYFGIDVFGRGQLAKFKSHLTLSKIIEYNFSVGIFAPGWTFEGLIQHGYNIKDTNGNADVNESFLLRNDKFWSLLWKYLPTHAYSQLPFYTDFCTGSGKYTFIYGKRYDEKFFNLSRQSLQPSIPIHNNAEYYFDDAINGGSCLKIMKCNQQFRLFLTEFHIDKTLIFAYVTKMNNPLCDIELILLLNDQYGMKYCEITCGYYNNTTSINGQIYLTSIDHNTYQMIKNILHEKNEPLKLPYFINNGWNVRYYSVSFDEPVIVRDIGVHFRTPSVQSNGYLGAIYCNSIDAYIPSAYRVTTKQNFINK